MNRALITIIALFLFFGLQAQDGTVSIDGKYFPYLVDECGDTIILASLNPVSISSFRKFKDDEEYRKYRRYRRYAVKVYPYATEAIKIFRELEYATKDLKKRHRKKYIRDLQKRLKKEFQDPLKKLTKTQGYILIKMIEKEVDRPMYFLIKDLKGGVSASYWSTLGKMYGYKLKDGYKPDQDPILDAVLNDLDVSYDLPKFRNN